MSRAEGELARATNHEADESWPVNMELVAYFGPQRTKRRSIEINPDEFFGRGRYGAPMGMERILSMVNQLRRRK